MLVSNETVLSKLQKEGWPLYVGYIWWPMMHCSYRFNPALMSVKTQNCDNGVDGVLEVFKCKGL